jgi:hypothetical protein
LPVRIASADLNGDGRGDIAVIMATGTVVVYLQNVLGGFGPSEYRIELGVGLADLTILDVDGVHGPDLVVTNQVAGDVSVLFNDAIAPFTSVARFRAGTGLYGVESRNGDMRVRSLERTTGITTGDFNGDGINDLIVTNTGANSVSVLLGTRTGGFLNPQPGLTFLAGSRPSDIVAGRFDRDTYPDVAILNREATRSGSSSTMARAGSTRRRTRW